MEEQKSEVVVKQENGIIQKKEEVTKIENNEKKEEIKEEKKKEEKLENPTELPKQEKDEEKISPEEKLEQEEKNSLEENQIKEEATLEEEKLEKTKPEKKKKSSKTKKDLKNEIRQNLKRLDKEYIDQINKTNEAIDDGKRIIIIEICQNCIAHQYCTHHDENKYNKNFLKIKNQIEEKFQNYFVSKNFMIPDPAIGAFEIRLNGQLIYSKIQSLKWPKFSIVENKINEYIEKENKIDEEKEVVEGKKIVCKGGDKENLEEGVKEKGLGKEIKESKKKLTLKDQKNVIVNK